MSSSNKCSQLEQKNDNNDDANLNLSYINEEYFTNIIAKNVENFQQILKFKILKPTKPGENYCSTLLRIIFDIELKDGSVLQNSYIVKTNINNIIFTDFLNMFPKEKQMYSLYLPRFEKFYEDVNMKRNLNPKCIYMEDLKGRITLVLEDMKCKDFFMPKRDLELIQMNEVLKKLAQFHAISVMYTEIHGEFEPLLKESFLTAKSYPMIIQSMQMTMKAIKKAILYKDMNDLKKYFNILPNPDDICKELFNINKIKSNQFNVLNHGDCRSNNIMFKYSNDGKKIDQTLFIDYQTVQWGSPAKDLWYLIVTSASSDIRISQFDKFIQIYHENLILYLKQLNYKKQKPTLRYIQRMMIEYGFWGVFNLVFIMPTILLPSNSDASVENMMKTGSDGDQFRVNAYINPDFIKTARQIMPFLYNKGCFDINSNDRIYYNQ